MDVVTRGAVGCTRYSPRSGGGQFDAFECTDYYRPTQASSGSRHLLISGRAACSNSANVMRSARMARLIAATSLSVQGPKCKWHGDGADLAFGLLVAPAVHQVTATVNQCLESCKIANRPGVNGHHSTERKRRREFLGAKPANRALLRQKSGLVLGSRRQALRSNKAL